MPLPYLTSTMPLTPHHRHLFAKALCRPPTSWIDVPPTAHLLSDESAHISTLPPPLLHSRHHPPSPTLCPTHSRLNATIISTLSTRILHEISLKLPLLTAALHSPPPTLKAKHIGAAKKLADAYTRIHGYFFAVGEGRGESVGGCEGCFVASFGGSPAGLFAFVAGARVWRRDRSAVGLWVQEWVGLCSRATRRRLAAEAELTGHWVRRVLRAARGVAELSADVDTGSGETIYRRIDTPDANPFSDRHAASFPGLPPAAANGRPSSSVYSAYTDVRPGDGVLVEEGPGVASYDHTDVYQRYRTARSEWRRLETVCEKM